MGRIQALEICLAVPEAKSFPGGVRKTGFSGPSAPRVVNSLEEQLGVRLFTRTTRAYAAYQRRSCLSGKRAANTIAGCERCSRRSRYQPCRSVATYVFVVVCGYLYCFHFDRISRLLSRCLREGGDGRRAAAKVLAYIDLSSKLLCSVGVLNYAVRPFRRSAAG